MMVVLVEQVAMQAAVAAVLVLMEQIILAEAVAQVVLAQHPLLQGPQ
jgi:hypothetical protein